MAHGILFDRVRHVSTLARWASLFVAVGIALVLWTTPASGEPVDCSSGTEFSVETAEQLNEAIACYNAAAAPAEFEISLGDDITSANRTAYSTRFASFEPITQSGPGYSLRVNGDGHILRGFGGAGTDVLLLAGTSEARVSVDNIVIANGTASGLVAIDAKVTFRDSTSTGNAGHAVLTRSSTVLILNSTLSESGLDALDADGSTVIANSTISAITEGGGRDGVSVSGGQATVTNSTITADRSAFGANSAQVNVSNSTLLGSVSESDGEVTVVSSITGDCRGAILDGGHNAGGCFGPGFFEVRLSPLADHGCAIQQATPTGYGCVKTYLLLGGASGRAIDGGSCDDPDVRILGPDGAAVPGELLTDQRGVSRAQGSTCDVGATEFARDRCRGRTTFTPATADELREAIDCYNASTTPDQYTVSLQADIATDDRFIVGSGSDFYGASLAVINHPLSGFPLRIVGNGHTLGAPNLLALASASQTEFVDVVFSRTGGALLSVVETDVTISDSSFEPTASIFAYQSGRVDLVNSTMTSASRAIRTILDGMIVVRRSTIVAATGIDNDGTVVITNSTIVTDGVGLFNRDRSARAYIANSTIIAGSGYAARNSYGVWNLSGTAEIRSSIVTSCRDFPRDAGFNAGGCFGGPSVDLGPLADNGCVTPHTTADGPRCVHTVALLTAAVNAIDSGTCTDVAIDIGDFGRAALGTISQDQREAPRAEGPECDIGAYELSAEPPRPSTPQCAGRRVTLRAQPGVPLQGTAGDDVILGSNGDDIIYGRGGNDYICGRAGDDTISAGSGDDRVWGGAGVDTIRGDAGADLINGDRGADVLLGGDGPDRILGNADDDVISGGPGDDRLQGNAGTDEIRGNAGDDRIFGHTGPDTLRGGEGDDLIRGGPGSDAIVGGLGHDMLYGAEGDDRLDGNAGDDLLYGNESRDRLAGGPGDDMLDGGRNPDECIGGSGSDSATRCETVFGLD